MHPAIERDAYWPDVFLRCHIPGHWLADQGVRVSVATFSTLDHVREILTAARWAKALGFELPAAGVLEPSGTLTDRPSPGPPFRYGPLSEA
jgi:hypothetical protein